MAMAGIQALLRLFEKADDGDKVVLAAAIDEILSFRHKQQTEPAARSLLVDIVGNSRAYLHTHSNAARNYCTFCHGESTSHADAVIHTETCPIGRAHRLVYTE